MRCLEDLGGVTREILTDRDSVFCSHEPAGPLFVPERVDLCELLGTVPRACRAYRAQTKGKVERENRELEQSFKCWLTGQVMPTRPTLADYDDFAARWIAEVILPRRHRTTGRIIGEAWDEERRLLTPIAEHVLQRFAARMPQCATSCTSSTTSNVRLVKRWRSATCATTRWRCEPENRAGGAADAGARHVGIERISGVCASTSRIWR